MSERLPRLLLAMTRVPIAYAAEMIASLRCVVELDEG